MGATPYNDATGMGVTFRVWAPFAAQVSVAGEFNHWSPSAHPLFSEGNGSWSVDVPGAMVGQAYKYVVCNPAGNPLWRNDPYARSIMHNAGLLNSCIASANEVFGTPGICYARVE